MKSSLYFMQKQHIDVSHLLLVGGLLSTLSLPLVVMSELG